MDKQNVILAELHALANQDNLPGMAHFGIDTEGRLGIAVPELRRIAKTVGRDHELALALWETGIPDARILATMVADPKLMTPHQMDAWVRDCNSWDLCDQACGNLFDKTPYAWDKVGEWAAEDAEFTRRAGFALLACLAWHDKSASDEKFIATFPIITAGSADPRNFVKKAVNWAIRNIGKRNLVLNTAAVELSESILAINDKTARWIARDALREISSEKILERLNKKEKNS